MYKRQRPGVALDGDPLPTRDPVMELRGIARDGDDETEIEEELERRRDAVVFVRARGAGGQPG